MSNGEETPPPAETSSASPAKLSIWEVYYPRDVMGERDSIPVASFPMIIYFWPAMVSFLVCGIFQSFGWFSPQALGMVSTAFLTLNLLVIVTDLDQKKFVIALLLIALAGAGVYISNLKDLGIASAIGGWFGSLDVHYSTHAYMIIGVVLLVLFGLGMVQPRFNYWRLERNEFVHYIQPFGRDQSIPRQGSTVTREVPDMLEMILTFGGGTIVIKREGQVEARIEHVPFLGRRMKAIERLLGSTHVTIRD